MAAFGSAEAATFEPIARGKSLVMSGKVVPGDVFMLDAAARASCDARGYCPERIFLNSPGGNFDAGIELAEFIRRWGIHTVVGETDGCASICVAIFAAGSNKVAFPTSRIGVHSASFVDAYTGQSGEALETTVLIARYMKQLGTPDTVITKMILTPGDDITWLTANDWPGLEIIHAGYVAPEQPQTTATSVSMTCSGERGQYVVVWSAAGMQVRDRFYAVTGSHRSPKTGAWVANGPTKYGTYAAVFGGPNPRMQFSNGKELVTDQCW
ncbi:ATP-dependent Clp protease proteolytic subunit [Mesorhizobium yinganensis]|uniref:ATP-dependent Clp protease proteolytic subunit n=1 Tax=Mesorhizobium yinganensis TaxID=3157707 RepID=UPI0032B76627